MPVRVVAVVSVRGRWEIDHVISPDALMVGWAVKLIIPAASALGTALEKAVSAVAVSGWQMPDHA